LIDLANERGGPDNVTAVVVDIEAAAEAEGAKRSPQVDAVVMSEILAQIPLFAGLSYREQASVLAIASAQRFAAGAQIVKEGAPSECVYIVVDGRLTVEKDGVQIAELEPGGTLGEMSLLGGAPRSATVRVASDGPARVLRIDRGALVGLMRRDPRLAVKLLWTIAQTLSDRLRDATDEIVQANKVPPSGGEEPFVVLED
jgi:signal-transduction protein with cAMP-binding, CBS, and nucleotidyltransferase domain